MTTTPHAIPSEILQLHTAVLGMTGSGKTGTTKLIIEQTVAEGGRVCVIDPIKSDHWGLTASESGQDGLPFHILGGPHGHVPLHAGAGKAIAGVVASGALPLSIIDMRLLQPGEPNRFYQDFCAELSRSMRGRLLLVLEEAHEWAPKERSGEKGENMSVYWTKRLATAGRSMGIRLLACTQRIAKLHNDLLSSCGTLIAHQVNFPADQKPIVDWFAGNFGKTEAARVAGELGKLRRGEAFIGSTLNHSLVRRDLPKYKTFDNTAAPSDHGRGAKAKVVEIDLVKLKALMGEAVKEAEASDPKVLREQIAKLEKDLKAARGGKDAAPAAPAAAPVVDQGAIDRAVRVAVHNERMTIMARLQDVQKRHEFARLAHANELSALEIAIKQISEVDTPQGSERGASRRGVMPGSASLERNTDPSTAAAAAATQARAQHGADTRGPKAGGGSSPPAEGHPLTGGQREVLEAIAIAHRVGATDIQNVVASLVCKHPRNKSLLNTIYSLTSAGYVTKSGSRLDLTPAGLASVSSVASVSTAQLRDRAVRQLPPRSIELLDAIVAARAISIEALAQQCGDVHPRNKSFLNAIYRLTGRCLVVKHKSVLTPASFLV